MTDIDPFAPFEMSIDIDDADIDMIGHVNNTVYLRWVQDAATQHWYAIASEEEADALLWVVVRHEIDYKRPAFRQDRLIARTWIGGRQPRFFERFTEVIRCNDDKLLSRTRTLWCPIEAKSKRAALLTPTQIARYSRQA